MAEHGLLPVENVASNDVLYQPVVMPHCEENVVVTGISCRLPQSENMQEFRDNLMNGTDMVTEDDTRWTPGKISFLTFYKTVQS